MAKKLTVDMLKELGVPEKYIEKVIEAQATAEANREFVYTCKCTAETAAKVNEVFPELSLSRKVWKNGKQYAAEKAAAATTEPAQS